MERRRYPLLLLISVFERTASTAATGKGMKKGRHESKEFGVSGATTGMVSIYMGVNS